MFANIIDDAHKELPSISRHTLGESMRYLAGEVLTYGMLDALAWRIAGNTAKLNAGIPAHPWTRQDALEWAPVQVVGHLRRRNKRGAPGYYFTFRILAGSAASLLTHRFWSARFCYYVSSMLGFSTIRRRTYTKFVPCRMGHPTEFTNLRLMVLLDPERSKEEPGFEKIKVPGSMYAWNRDEVLRYRDRHDAAHACPFGLPLTLLCYACPHGYESCRAGCHKPDYVFKYCAACDRQNVAFNLDVAANICLSCAEAKALQR